MRKRQAVLLLVFMLAFGFHAWSQEGSNEYEYSFLRDPDFWLATSANLMGMGLFLSRVHAPNAAKWFGYGTQLLGLPALALGLTDIIHRSADLSTWANLGYAAWAMRLDAVDVIYTDQMKSYRILEPVFDHKSVNHSVCYIDGDIHTNGIEGFWSLLKRGINGAFYHVSAKHLSLYLDEFMWRFNNRRNARIFETLLGNCAGNLGYATLTA